MGDLDLVKKYQKEILLLSRTNAVLGWDQSVYMPKKGAEARAEQISFLSSLAHEKMISDELFNAVSRLKKENLDGDDKIMIDKLYRDISKARKLPKEFVKELSMTTAMAESKWEEARKKSDFKMFQPWLEKIVFLKRKQAKYIGLAGHPYNSLLDDYEEGMTVDKIKPILEQLKNGLIEIIRKIKSSDVYKKQKLVLLKKEFPRDTQMEFCKDVVKRMGLNEDSSRIDFSTHPFTTDFDVNDVRITTNIRKSPMFSFGSTMHEAGHALYDLDYPEEHRYNVLGDTPSMGIHESQSRFWELMIGLGMPFWKFYFPNFQKSFKLNGNIEDWYKEINLVEPSMIRIESNEVYYNMHIILRFELELGLIEGSIEVKDLPKLWNQRMKEYIGIIPKNDVEGVMQDVHWANGYFGYFPTYALGTIYSAQLYNKIKEDIPRIEKDLEKGDYTKIRDWLKEKIHKHGRKFMADDLIKKVCGRGLNPQAFLDYLNNKYSEIYKF